MSRDVELLKSLGFSQQECLIYLSLLGETESREIGKVLAGANMPQSEAETAIKNLVNKGLVKVVSNRLEVRPPSEFLTRIIEQKREELERQFNDARQTALSLQALLERRYMEVKLGIKLEDIIEPLDSLSSMEVRTAKIIANARSEILIFAETFGWYDKIREALFSVLEKGVKVKVLMMVIDEGSARRAKELGQFNVEVKLCVEDWYPVRGTLVDHEELVFLIWATRKSLVSQPKAFRPHYTRNLGLIRIFSDAFRERWEEAKPI